MPNWSRTRSLLTVGDLFCGAGGFAEGFRQAGFKIAWGVDSWKDATDTFDLNFPNAETYTQDILDLKPADLPRVDVLIGSPPCVHFSPANRGGSGDREAGMKLVERFLRFVRELDPAYWVMENVPALRGDLEQRMAGFRFVKGRFVVEIPKREVLDASRHGTPQTRRRLFSGSFPVPSLDSQSSIVPLRRIVDYLPDPGRPRPSDRTGIADPMYEGCQVPAGELRDHFEDNRWRLTQDAIDSTEDRRRFDRIYGVMPFPDDLDKPARTITATRTRGSRATIVIPYNAPPTEPQFRTLTVRECASAQGFPLTYQFASTSMSGKDSLVGNAVPPPLARAIASGILLDAGRVPTSAPLVVPPARNPPAIDYRLSRGKHFTLRRRFRGSSHIDWRRDHRVELDNELPSVRSRIPDDAMPHVTWRCRVYLGYANLYRCYELRLPTAIALAREVVSDGNSVLTNSILSSTLLSAARRGLNGFPDGYALQRVWSEWTSECFSPRQVLSMVDRDVGSAMPAADWRKVIVPVRLTERLLEGCVQAQGAEAVRGQPLPMTARLFAGALCLSLLCERINNGSTGLERVHEALCSRESLLSPRLDPIVSMAARPPGPSRRQLALPPN